MSELEAWSFIVGILMPLLVAVFEQPGWSNRVRAIIGAGASVVAGLVTVHLQHGLHFDEHMLASVATVIIAAQTTYGHFWKPTGVAPAIEAKTTLGHTH